MIVDDHNLVDVFEPLFGEHADGGRAAAHAHALFQRAVDNRRLGGLDDDGDAVVDGQFPGFAVAQRQ